MWCVLFSARAESVVSEASSWTEYTSEATLTESEVDLDPDDSVTVRKVTRVKRVVEVGDDGEERVMSKVTETVTSVTEGGEIVVTREEVKINTKTSRKQIILSFVAFNMLFCKTGRGIQ